MCKKIAFLKISHLFLDAHKKKIVVQLKHYTPFTKLLKVVAIKQSEKLCKS